MIFQNSTTSFRLAYIHAPPTAGASGALSAKRSASASLYTLFAQKALSSSTPEDVLSVLDRISPSLKTNIVDAGAQAVLSEDSNLHAIIDSKIEIDPIAYGNYIKGSALLRKAIGLSEANMGLIINGRVCCAS